jgi:CPA1 family monovalent cation:H+ antiporter
VSYDFPIVLLFLAIPLVALGKRLGLPYPLEPEVVLLVVLPPLLFWEAYAAPVGEMRTNAGWVFTLSVSLVVVTIGAVALCVHMLEPAIPWPVAFMLGAIVAPTDNIAFSFVADRLGMPRRLKAIVQGESLFNDALALVLYAAALNAALDGSFVPSQDIRAFFQTAILSIVYGAVTGWLALMFLARLKETELQTAILVVLPFVAYVPAIRFDLSGVLAVVTAGIVVSLWSSSVTTYTSRLRFNGFSQTGSFLINAVLFLLIGLQLRVVQDDPAHRSPGELIFDAFILNCIIIGVRFLWVYARGYVLRLFGHRIDPRYLAVIAWSGMRGSVSLAAAISIPYAVVSGADFPDRHFVLFMTFSVIVVTLVGQGLTLAPLVRQLGLQTTDADEEEVVALREIAQRALLAIGKLEREGLPAETVAGLRRRFDRFSGAFADHLIEGAESLQREAAIRKATLTVIAAQRQALLELCRERRIDYSTEKKIERLLDLQEAETAQVRVALAPRLTEFEALRKAEERAAS